MLSESRNKTDLRNLSLRDLVNSFLAFETNSSVAREIIKERIAQSNAANLYDLIVLDNIKPRHVLDETARATSYNIEHRRPVLPESLEMKGPRQLPSPQDIRTLPVHELANLMLDNGYTGESLRVSEKAADYIYMAANNSDVEDELPDAGHAFWRAARFDFERWVARKKRGV